MTVPLTEEPTTTNRFGQNWVIHILPYTEYADLFKQFDLTVDVSSSSSSKNIMARATTMATMLCPSDANYNSKPYIPGTTRAAMGTTPWARGNYAANSCIQYLDGPPSVMPDGESPYFVQGAGSHGWSLTYQRGVMGCNTGLTTAQITDGLSHTCLLAEIRAGLASVDARGVWALGACGSSTLWGHGCIDGSGVNNPAPLSDDLLEGTEIIGLVSATYLTEQRMGVDGSGESWQAGVRSMHPAGANIAMCDGSVQFLSNDIACNTGRIYPATLASDLFAFERIMASGDGLMLDPDSF
jgi:prepilin-type processing-associated H-X9-DG protein